MPRMVIYNNTNRKAEKRDGKSKPRISTSENIE